MTSRKNNVAHSDANNIIDVLSGDYVNFFIFSETLKTRGKRMVVASQMISQPISDIWENSRNLQKTYFFKLLQIFFHTQVYVCRLLKSFCLPHQT